VLQLKSKFSHHSRTPSQGFIRNVLTNLTVGLLVNKTDVAVLEGIFFKYRVTVFKNEGGRGTPLSVRAGRLRARVKAF
jgi:hypothetical protein